MRKVITTEEVHCDICGAEVEEKYLMILRLHRDGGDRDDQCFDFCSGCGEKVRTTLDFITSTAMVHIIYVWCKSK